MMSDQDIDKALGRGDIDIDPLDADSIQPCSYDVHLGPTFLQLDSGGLIDPRRHEEYLPYVNERSYMLDAGGFVLGATIEKVSLARHVAAQVEGKSSLARLGLMVHVTAGFIDAGFSGQVTLEIVNLNRNRPIVLHVGMAIAQLSFQRLDSPARNPYVGKYQNQKGATGSRYYLNQE